MSPAELATRYPHIYHVTEPGAWPNIKQYGLLSTSHLLDLFEVPFPYRETLETRRRPSSVVLKHPAHGRAILNDNLPLQERALAKCLDDGLLPSDWVRMLNGRVFFWAGKEGLNRLLKARLNRTRPREVLIVDTLSLAKVHAEQIELSPINSGATLRKAARRGLKTFTPLLQHSFKEWSQLRGRRDKVLELTVKNYIPDIADHVIDVLRVEEGSQTSAFLC